MRRFAHLLTLSVLVTQMAGCGQGWQMEYGDAAAHFNEDSMLEKAQPFIGKLIVVKGVVAKQDLTDPENCKVYLQHSICCNLGDSKRMAESYAVGKTVFISGILKRCKEGDVLLEPAGGRDPKAEFNPR